MKNLAIFFSLPLMLAYISAVHAYKQPTHKEMSEFAAEASVLKTDPEVLRSLGLDPWDKKQTFQIALSGLKTMAQRGFVWVIFA